MRKILIVDDDYKFLLILENALARLGYQIFIARNSNEVLEIIDKEKPDLLLINILMKKIDTSYLFKVFKENYINMKCIVISNITKKNEDEYYFQNTKILIKPFSLKQILQQIESLFILK
ncbi:MAG: response regulator [Bacteroidetes bacterium]|jgi:DNA-binding NtrC family response regulator|nr:response regulator [Bacteroidota bacterium]